MGTEQSAITKFALNDILSGLASGLNDAQKQLRNMAPYDEFGRPNVMYQLPYLDFQLQVNSEFESTQTEETISGGTVSSGSKAILPVRFGAPRSSFKFSTVKNMKAEKGNVEMKSTITGRFVAVTPNEGLPQMVLRVISEAPVNHSDTEYKVVLKVELANTSGEKIHKSLIEFNFDKELSDSVNPNLSYTNPKFSISEVRTDENGIATTDVIVTKNDYDINGIRFILLVGFGTISKSISICKN